ncbi:MAG: SoxR reducing system RseC family protein [Woeseiaceae bacterium]|jgi:sigma-E factor negative regulatory protein RseC
MENPRGRVIAINYDEASPHALVEVDSVIQCARCAQGKGCGAGLLGATSGSRRVDALVGTGLAVSEGDEVRIELAPSDVLKASIIVYGTPLAGAVTAAVIAYLAGLGDLYAALAAIFGLASGLLVARTRLQKAGCLRRFTPTVVERIAASVPTVSP